MAKLALRMYAMPSTADRGPMASLDEWGLEIAPGEWRWIYAQNLLFFVILRICLYYQRLSNYAQHCLGPPAVFIQSRWFQRIQCPWSVWIRTIFPTDGNEMKLWKLAVKPSIILQPVSTRCYGSYTVGDPFLPEMAPNRPSNVARTSIATWHLGDRGARPRPWRNAWGSGAVSMQNMPVLFDYVFSSCFQLVETLFKQIGWTCHFIDLLDDSDSLANSKVRDLTELHAKYYVFYTLYMYLYNYTHNIYIITYTYLSMYIYIYYVYFCHGQLQRKHVTRNVS